MLEDLETPHFDVIVIGAGITSMYQLYMLREMGFSVKGYDASSDVGGTWYRNRYPGCRLDTESHAYGYYCLKGITPDWSWKERFADQPTMLRYCNHAADRMDIRKSYQFDTRVARAAYNPGSELWELGLGDGSEACCRFLISGRPGPYRHPRRRGVSLKRAWDDGPLTYLGVQVHGFPNFFTLVGPHSGATFCNVGVCGGLQVEWLSRMVGSMRDHGLTYSEAQQEPQEKWTQKIYDDFARTLLPEANAWWVRVKSHPDGTVTRRTMVHVSGGPEYRRVCEEVAANAYEGFAMH